MINPRQLVEYVIRPALKHLNMYSEAAENLLLGTAVHESGLKHIRQIGGPAVGLWQMEPTTHDDIWENYINNRRDLKSIIKQISGARYLRTTKADSSEMYGNLNYACAMARIHYYRKSEPLPDKDDIEGLADYWKTHYNTRLGKGEPHQFVEAYKRMIG